MSRFFKYKWPIHSVYEAQILPVGWRRFWGFRNLPYRTGDELILCQTLKLLELGTRAEILIQGWRMELISERENLHREYGYMDVASGFPISFGRSGYSGEYVIDVVLVGLDSSTGQRHEVERIQRVAVIQVKQDYILWLIIGFVSSIVIGGIVGHFITRLFGN